jgi:transposase-like protein
MRAPVLAAGDGALGFRDALREVFPGTRQGRCWFRKTASVPGALPGSAHPGANRALAGIWGAGDNDHARAAVTAFGTADRLKFPKAVATITGDLDELPACCGSPAGHWVHLRTASPVKPAFATVAFKLIGAAQDHCRMVSAPHLVTLLKAGARFEHGVLTGRPEPAAA